MLPLCYAAPLPSYLLTSKVLNKRIVVFQIFVIILFISLSDKYGIFDVVSVEARSGVVFSNIDYGDLTYYILILAGCVLILIFREIWQMAKMKLRQDRILGL